MKKIIFIFFSLICFITSSAQEQDSLKVDSLKRASHKEFAAIRPNQITKVDGDSAYIKGDYALAIQIYETILKSKGVSADIYYNLGNSYYKIDNISKSILNFERALLLKPGDSDIRHNLEIARSKTVDKAEPLPEIFIVSWIKALINCMGVDAWAKCGISLFFLFLIALYLFIFTKRIFIKKLGFVLSIILLVFVFTVNIFASRQKESLLNRTNAIIIGPSITVKSTPNESGTNLFILHEGRKVSIKDNSMREWKEIKLEDGNVGWVPANIIEII